MSAMPNFRFDLIVFRPFLCLNRTKFSFILHPIKVPRASILCPWHGPNRKQIQPNRIGKRAEQIEFASFSSKMRFK